ncbi:MAG: hypothetical protein V3S37_05955 [Dehalococcoidia bacterium]
MQLKTPEIHWPTLDLTLDSSRIRDQWQLATIAFLGSLISALVVIAFEPGVVVAMALLTPTALLLPLVLLFLLFAGPTRHVTPPNPIYEKVKPKRQPVSDHEAGVIAVSFEVIEEAKELLAAPRIMEDPEVWMLHEGVGSSSDTKGEIREA